MDLEKQFNRIIALNDNWNDNGARKFDKDFVLYVKNVAYLFKHKPEIFPTMNNSIQLEFKKDGRYLEVEFVEDSYLKLIKVFVLNNSNTDGEEFEVYSLKQLFEIEDKFYEY